MKKRPEEEHKKTRHIPPAKALTLPKRFGRAVGIVATAATLSFAPSAEARPSMRDTQGPKPPHAADTGKPRSAGPREGQGADLSPAIGNVQTSVRIIREDAGEGTISIDYVDSSGRESGISIPFSEERGELVQAIPGRERSVLVFENSIVIAVGYDASFRGELLLRMDGSFRNSSAVEFPLPADCKNGNLLSATVATGEDGSESILYFINKAGHVRAASIEAWNAPYATAQLLPSENAKLSPVGRGIAMLFKPGSGTLTFLKADFSSESITPNELPIPASTSPPSVSTIGMETVLSIGGSRFLVAETVPGDFSSLQLVALE
ncbi:hypothetical protein H0O01_04000 [Candidatus Micrarchaeota archaeon]|nr:hypothetical protein [Candidatus Micrarchaeota archaeon]